MQISHPPFKPSSAFRTSERQKPSAAMLHKQPARPSIMQLNGISKARMPVAEQVFITFVEKIIALTSCTLAVLGFHIYDGSGGETQGKYQHANVDDMSRHVSGPGPN